jgi:signal transduction histidine kinase
VSADQPAEALIDAQLIRQALLNIPDNALKYSPPGATIDVAVRKTTDAGMIEVLDRGPGIGTPHRGKIFERFYRVDDARSRETGGTGLGLSIALWAVRANGGDIEVESEIGKGSRFRVCFPLLPLRS